MGWDDVVGIVTWYKLDDPGIEPCGGEILRTCLDQPWSPHSLLYKGYGVPFPEIKWPGHGINHPPQSSAEVKERALLYLYSPSGFSWPVLGGNLPFYLSTSPVILMWTTFSCYFCGTTLMMAHWC